MENKATKPQTISISRKDVLLEIESLKIQKNDLTETDFMQAVINLIPHNKEQEEVKISRMVLTEAKDNIITYTINERSPK